MPHTPTRPLENWLPPAFIDPRLAGSVSIDPPGPFVAGSYARLTLTYTAGRFGIDDTGAIRVCFRFATDGGPPQFDKPAAPNFVSVEASNGARLDLRYDYKLNTRPWDRTIVVRVARGYMREGDTITLRFGDPRGGSPGFRLQTFVDPFHQFLVLNNLNVFQSDCGSHGMACIGHAMVKFAAKPEKVRDQRIGKGHGAYGLVAR